MARKEKQPNRRVKTERVGSVTLFLTPRSPYWWMYWTQVADESDLGGCSKRRRREKMVSTGETDLSLARVIAAKKNEQLFTRKRYSGTTGHSQSSVSVDPADPRLSGVPGRLGPQL